MSDKSQNAAVAGPTYVEWQRDFPAATPTVKVTFEGLFCFFFDGKEGCFVGTHNTTRQAGHQHAAFPHDYKITIVQKDGSSTTTDSFLVGDPRQSSPLNIKVTGADFPPDLDPGVYVYTGPNRDRFNRKDGDERDWRWIIDFEEVMYPDGVKGINSTALRPGIKIDAGLFYTQARTSVDFILTPEGGGASIQLNKIAKVTAANIYLKEGGSVSLRGGPVGKHDLNFAPNRTFEVNITNLCDGNSHPPCKFDPHSLDKKNRNDFFLYYDIFDQSQNRPEYLLIRIGEPGTDDSPCGAVGFGQTPQP